MHQRLSNIWCTIISYFQWYVICMNIGNAHIWELGVRCWGFCSSFSSRPPCRPAGWRTPSPSPSGSPAAACCVHCSPSIWNSLVRTQVTERCERNISFWGTLSPHFFLFSSSVFTKGSARWQYVFRGSANISPHLHHNPHKQFINVVTHARGRLSELCPKLDGEVATVAGLQHSAPLQVRLVPHLGRSWHGTFPGASDGAN